MLTVLYSNQFSSDLEASITDHDNTKSALMDKISELAQTSAKLTTVQQTSEELEASLTKVCSHLNHGRDEV